ILIVMLAGCSGGPADGSGTQVGEAEGPAANSADESTQEQAPEPEPPALGTRQNPVPTGTEVEVGPNWTMAVVEVIPDAWEIVEKENMFNEPPGEGRQYVMARLRVSYVGDESGTPWIDLSLRYLGANGTTY